MFIEFCERFGGPSARVEVSQIVIRSADGTPYAVAAEYGPRGA